MSSYRSWLQPNEPSANLSTWSCIRVILNNDVGHSFYTSFGCDAERHPSHPACQSAKVKAQAAPLVAQIQEALQDALTHTHTHTETFLVSMQRSAGSPCCTVRHWIHSEHDARAECLHGSAVVQFERLGIARYVPSALVPVQARMGIS